MNTTLQSQQVKEKNTFVEHKHRTCPWLDVFSRYVALITCFPALGTVYVFAGYIFSALDAGYVFSRAWLAALFTSYMFNYAQHYQNYFSYCNTIKSIESKLTLTLFPNPA